MKELVEITADQFDVIFDLRYATANNVCGKKLYSRPFCYLRNETINPLKKAIKSAQNLGLKIKIFDSFRPIEVQKFMFDKFPSNGPNGGFVSDPENGTTPHCRGIAIDLTLCDLQENELFMGTDFDEFSDVAFHDCQKISVEAQKNRLILLGIMTNAGFDFNPKEWWHYQLPNPRNYGIIQSEKDLIATL
jgi:D-alanyl-D-alanine dipeptidase